MSKHDEKHTSEISMEELDNVSGGAADNFLYLATPALAPTAPAPSSTLTAAPAPSPRKAGGDF
jgi:hypothetical protein